MKARQKNDRGAAVIEFAILLLLLIPLLFGIIEFGFIWAQSHYLSHAAREGARAGARVALFDSHLNTINNSAAVRVAVENSVKSSLEKAPFYSGRVDDIATISPPVLVNYGATQPALKVRVTVDSAAIWPPLLWPLLSLLPGGSAAEGGHETLSDQAVFAIGQ